MSTSNDILTIHLHAPIHLQQGRLNYTLRFIEQHPLVQNRLRFVYSSASEDAISLYYGLPNPSTKGFAMPAQQLFFLPDQQIDVALLFSNSYFSSPNYCYSVEPHQRTERPFFQDRYFQFDLFETLFFHISRYEEWQAKPSQLDQWDMMEAAQQWLVRRQLHRTPVVDRMLEAFIAVLGLEKRQEPMRCQITHDIDALYKFDHFWRPWRASLGLLRRLVPPQAYFRLWQSYFQGSKSDPYDTFDWMLQEEGQQPKIIYLLVGGQTKYDTPIDLYSPIGQRMLRIAKERGYSVGLHPSYNCWTNELQLKQEWEYLSNQIKAPIEHSRQHYLHFKWPITLRLLQELGIKTDGSLGFNDRIGFRCGTSFPYQCYDFEREAPFAITSVPLALMDSALLQEGNYQKAKIDQILSDFLAQNAFNTQISINFHNSRFDDAYLWGIPLRVYYDRLLNSV